MTLPEKTPLDTFTGGSPQMQSVVDTVRRVAATGVDILILGETGTGKELVARALHDLSERPGPFVPVDCGAIPENLLESELFGYERGAFTGADRQRRGLMESADKGTFFLDEIGDMPLVLQAKLLRVLQERRLRRVGGNDEVSVDLRIIAATSLDLDRMVVDREFREDLYYRINVVRIDLPPLRERGDDLGLLAEFFTERFSREMGRSVPALDFEAFKLLKRYHWPGNIRELQNVIRRAIALCDGNTITVNDLPVAVVTAARARDVTTRRGYFETRDEYLARFEREYFISLLQRHRGNVKAACEEAQLPRGTLYRLIKALGVDPASYRH